MKQISLKRGFTLIELLLVIAIIGILATVVLVSLGEVQNKAKIASIQANLNNLQSSAMIYSLENNTFEGLCNYTAGTVHSSIQNHIDELKNIAGVDNVTCIVKTSEVPYLSQYTAADQLERRNFGVAVYFNERHYAVDMSGVMMLDTIDATTTARWDAANEICATGGKRLPSVEVLKAINDNGAQGGNLSLTSNIYWSSTFAESSDSYAYSQHFGNGNAYRHGITLSLYVRCAT